jgi:hypothetical protein
MHRKLDDTTAATVRHPLRAEFDARATWPRDLTAS